jgi:spermidine synthase
VAADRNLGQGLAVQLGLGAGAITRFTHGPLGMHTQAVEINPLVVNACRLWFKLPEDGPRLQVHRSDALRWLQQDAVPASTRLLHVDLYDHEAAAPVLDDETFYAACRAVLAPGGVMSVNLFGRHASFAASAARIATVFGTDQVWSLRPTREGNTVVVAGQGVGAVARGAAAAGGYHRAALRSAGPGCPRLAAHGAALSCMNPEPVPDDLNAFVPPP